MGDARLDMGCGVSRDTHTGVRAHTGRVYADIPVVLTLIGIRVNGGHRSPAHWYRRPAADQAVGTR